MISETPIVIAFTPNYFVPAATTILSILQHTTPSERLHIIVLLSEELPERMKDKLSILGKERVRYTYLNLQGRLGEVYVDERYTEAASYRLLLPNLLPDYDKVIYIDCDIIVRNDIVKLYQHTHLDDNYLAGVYEAPLDFQKSRFESLGCNPKEYINSGFLLMNLAQLRKDDMVNKMLKALNVDYLEFPDQDVINQTCKGRIVALPPYYNSIRTFFLPQYKEAFTQQYSEEEWHEVQQHGTIHYTGGKPWNLFTVGFLSWWNCYEQLPQCIKEEWQVNKKMLRLYKVYRTRIGKAFIDGAQTIYRKLRYRK